MPVSIADIMTQRPVTTTEDTSIHAVAKLMKQYRISSLIVLSKDKQLAGIVTVDDIVRQAVASNLDMEKPVAVVMTNDVVTITPDVDVREAISLFNEYEIRQAPVMQGKTLVGYVTLKDILRFEPALLDIAVENLRVEEEHRREMIQKIMNPDEMLDEEDML